MEQPSNGPGSDTAGKSAQMTDRVRDRAGEAMETFQDAVERGRELVLRHPLLSLAGAAATGWLVARLIARRR